MKHKHSKTIALLSACCFVAAAIVIPRGETKTCEAATSAERIFFDNFDGTRTSLPFRYRNNTTCCA